MPLQESSSEASSSSDSENPLNTLEALIPPRPPKPPSTTSISLDSLLDPPLRLHEDLKEGCGGQVWPAGMVLAKYLLEYQREEMGGRGKMIIELGAGSGLVGLSLALGLDQSKEQKQNLSNDPGDPTHHILLTDQQPLQRLLHSNIALNGLEHRATAQILDWGTVPLPEAVGSHFRHGGSDDGADEVGNPNTGRMDPSTESNPATPPHPIYPDTILAADCVYFEPAFTPLLNTLSALLGPESVCYFCAKRRRKADARFMRELRRRFDVRDVEYRDKERDGREGVGLVEVRRKG